MGVSVRCVVCGSDDSVEIHSDEGVCVWTDMSDDLSVRVTYPSRLQQCPSCGHVYQPVTPELRDLLAQIYESSEAQGPSSMGSGSWGLERVDRLFFGQADLRDHRSVLEIGCGNGYLLSRLKERGFERAVGIEPSVNARQVPSGVRILTDFVHEQLKLGETFDLIFAIAVFEHIENLSGVLSFCRKHLNPAGDLFFVVPNAESQLATGDPGLFVHQHVHYFTQCALSAILRRTGFQVARLVMTNEAFFVTARAGETAGGVASAPTLYTDYARKLDATVSRINALAEGGGLVVHGACNALNNIIGKLAGDFFVVDNDENKQDKRYFGRVVHSVESLDFQHVRTVLAMAHPFLEQIRSGYVQRGFTGSVVSPVTLGAETR